MTLSATSPSGSTTQRPPGRWRQVTAWVLLVIFCLGLASSTVTIWARNQAFDTSAYVETVTPLAADPDIQNAVANQVTVLLSEQIRREDVAVGSEDSMLRTLAMPIVLDFVHRTVLGFVQSSEFQAFWVSANEIAHRNLITALTSDAERTLTLQDGQLILDLSPMVAEVQARLQASGLAVLDRVEIDPARAVFVLFESETVADIQRALDLLDTLAVVLPAVTLAALAGCLMVARGRLAMAFRAAIGAAIAMTLLIVGLRLVRSLYLDALGPDRDAAAAAALIDIVLRDLRDGARLLTLLALMVAGFLGIAGSAWIRQPRVVAPVARYRVGITAGILGAACVALIAVDQVPLGLTVGVVVLALAGVVMVAWVARIPIAPAAGAGSVTAGATAPGG